jgi:hypothetical protein
MAMLLAGILSASTVGWARDDAADTEAASDEAVGRCVTSCEAEHEKCASDAKSRKSECDRQQSSCDQSCALCTRLNGPQVMYCANDCNACLARIKASPCAKGGDDEADCTRALDACLERCGP